MTRPPTRRPALVLPLLAAGVAAALLAGGYALSRQERVVRIEREDRADEAFALALQRRLDALESDYEAHLRRVCLVDVESHFAPRDAIEEVVGLVQLSTLNPDGRVERHLLARDAGRPPETVPLPVFDEAELPPGRPLGLVVEGREGFRPGTWFVPGAGGWLETPGWLLYGTPVSMRRAVLLLIEPEAVDSAVAEALAAWAGETLAAGHPGSGADALVARGVALATVGEPPAERPDAVRRLRYRFGDWELHSWDERRRVVEIRRGILAGAAGLALLVLAAGAAGSLHLHRALRLAERRVSFVNRVSHELKTPLTNILLNADLAADGASPAGRRRLGMVREEARRLARLVENVLAFSKQEQGTAESLEPRPAALRPLVEELLGQFGPALERRGLRVELAVPPDCAASVDPAAFAQILGNLVSNVEKYAAAGGLLRIEAAAENGGQVALRVADLGPGIPEAERERVFQPFRRLDDRTSAGASGTGLGLAIARELAGRLDGSLRILPPEGEPARGAVFELRLPAAAGPDADEKKLVTFPGAQAS